MTIQVGLLLQLGVVLFLDVVSRGHAVSWIELDNPSKRWSIVPVATNRECSEFFPGVKGGGISTTIERKR